MSAHEGTDDLFRVHVLGVGDADSENHRTTSFLVQAGYRLILLEAPTDLRHRLKQYRDTVKARYFGGSEEVPGIDGLTLDNIHHIIVTHDDSDHSAGLDPIALYKWWKQKPSIREDKRPPYLYCMDRVADSLEAAIGRRLRANGCSLRECYDIVNLDPGQPAEIGEVTVTAHLADHGKDAIGVLLVYGGRRLSYSGETRISRPLLDFLSKADVMIHECTGTNQVHTKPEELRQWLDSSDYSGTLYTCHFSDDCKPKEHGLTPLEEMTFIDVQKPGK
jgi:ribonuclease BN (tRNA processing enzyme)